MKIVSIRHLGRRAVYSPEMAGRQHNYITLNSRAVHKNSHGVSYCLVAHRCLWLKAHFAPEFWASVMTDCHPDKLVRYMGVARSERWEPTHITRLGAHPPDPNAQSVQFGTININKLTKDFTVTGDVVNQGLIGIKGLGTKAAQQWMGEHEFTSLDEFIAEHGKDKSVLERFIKLGAFRQFPGYENARATWEYYRYKYCSGKEITTLRNEIKQRLLLAEGWTQEAIEQERQRQTTEYFKVYPNRKKLPKKIQNWHPEPDDSFPKVAALYPEDYGLAETLEFEKAYLGYYLHNPLHLYRTKGNCSISEAKQEATETGEEVKLEGIVKDFEVADSKNGKPYGRLRLSDGIQSVLVMIFGRSLGMQNLSYLKPGTAITFFAEYDKMRGTFALSKGEMISKLPRRE